jgi:hypothetical protein
MFVAGSAIFNSKPSSPRSPAPRLGRPTRTQRPLARPPARPRARAPARDCRLKVVDVASPGSPSPPPPHPPTAEDYKATIDGMRAELAQVPFPGKAKIAA